MEISILHSFLGDKEIDFNPDSEEDRKKLGETLTKLLQSGTAIFLERADKTYRVTGFDPNTDKLIVQNPGRWPTGEAKHQAPPEGYQPNADLPSIEPPNVGSNAVIPKPRRGRPRGVRAGLRRGHLTAVAPTAGG